jgi:hypothetical protein
MSYDKMIDELSAGDVVLYRDHKYKINNITKEGGLKNVCLTSLTSPRRIASAAWKSGSRIWSSNLKAEKFRIVDYISQTTFKLCNDTEFDVSTYTRQILEWLIEGRHVYITINTCFGASEIGVIFSILGED